MKLPEGRKMKHVKWALPDSPDADRDVHFLYDGEWTFCGLAFEGTQERVKQGFEETSLRVTCPGCIDRVQVAQRVKYNLEVTNYPERWF